MIYLTKVITINKGSSSIDEQIVLYKGDKNVEVQFVLKNNPFKQKNGTVSAYATYGQLIIDREAGPIISEVSQLSNNRVIFVITGEMIDEIEELGDYDFQIRLFNEDQSSRVTLPPVENGIRIEEPLCEEATVNTTYVNSEKAVVMPANDGIMLLAADEPEGIFDADGSYNRTNWCSGDIITDARLNKVEEALYQINDNASNDYATEEYVDDSVRNARDYIESNYATTSYVDDQRRATEAYAESYTNNAIGRLDLSNNATESFVTDSINSNNNYIETVVLKDYVTDQELEDAINGIEGGGNVDLTGYATEAYVDQALTNYPTHSEMKSTVKDVMPDIIEINHSVFTGDEFAIDDYNNYVAKSVLLYNTTIGFDSYKHELVHMQLGMDYESSNRTIVVYSPRGSIFSYSITKDGTITRTGIESFATQDTINSTLSKRNYATQDYVNEQIGDINAILDAINGEEV